MVVCLVISSFPFKPSNQRGAPNKSRKPNGVVTFLLQLTTGLEGFATLIGCCGWLEQTRIQHGGASVLEVGTLSGVVQGRRRVGLGLV